MSDHTIFVLNGPTYSWQKDLKKAKENQESYDRTIKKYKI